MPELQLVPKPIPDAEARQRALDITQSFLVEAPAGSGKTTLLIQRYLKLLASDTVTDPAQVLAITFTRKATAEMRDRVLKLLSQGAPSQTAPPFEVGPQYTQPTPGSTPSAASPLRVGPLDQSLVQAVLTRDRQLNWNLLDHPHRLNIRTIDSISQEIANGLPILSGSGGAHAPNEDAAPLYAEASRRTLMLLGGPDPALHVALETLLLHRDGNLANCEEFIASMLQTRDQWGELVPLTLPELDDQYLDETVLPTLDRALDQAICHALTRLSELLPSSIFDQLTTLAAEMGSLDGYRGNPSPIALCAGLHRSPQAATAHLDHWRALLHLVVKPSKPRVWRKAVSRNNVRFEILKHHQLELKQIIAQLADLPGLLEAIGQIADLPPAQYPREQWQVTKALFRVLARALTELQLVFAERAQCDFAEVGLLARAALRNDSALDDLATSSGLRLQHLLVDEMQDTSTAQYEFIQLLTRRWDAHSQTVFVVGDPRQSIYAFRQARVERFLQTLQTRRLGDLPLTVLRLTANFRSQPALVQAFNEDFTQIFPGAPSSAASSLRVGSSDTPGAPSIAASSRWVGPSEAPGAPSSAASSLRVGSHNSPGAPSIAASSRWVGPSDAPGAPSIAASSPRVGSHNPPGAPSQSASSIEVGSNLPYHPVHSIRTGTGDRQWHPAPVPYPAPPAAAIAQRALHARQIREIIERHPTKSVAVLVRNRPHLKEIVAALRQAPAIPFPAVDIDLLAERPEILDLLALTRALLHPADRTAWLALLRSPACGLSLADLHRLAHDEPESTLFDLMTRHGHELSPDGIARLQPFWTVLAQALTLRGAVSLSAWVAQTWRTLGFPAHLTPDALTNAETFFQLLDQLEEPGTALALPRLQQKIAKLYAAPSTDPNAVDLMTLHKAKGLEWDIVLVPELHRAPRTNTPKLFSWLELDPIGILAPIAARGAATAQLNLWIRSVENAREAAERKRLFYVACTRAKDELHLFAAPQRKVDGGIFPGAASLLQAAWPAAEPHFTNAQIVEIPTQTFALAAAASPRVIQRIPHLPGAPSQSASPIEVGSKASSLPFSLFPLPSSFPRPEGSFSARVLGNTLHAFLDLLATRPFPADLQPWRPRILAVLRASGLSPSESSALAATVLRGLAQTLADPEGRWLLSPHPQAASESSLQTASAAIRLDRTFLAGPTPLAPGTTHRWIIDYKTATHSTDPASLPAFLAAQRALYAPQLEAYAQTLDSSNPIRLALYYPLLPHLLWWSPN